MPRRRRCRLLAPASLTAALTLATAMAPVQAAEGDPEIAPDPKLVIARTVEPRIAYRGVPREDNPIRSQATTFPSTVFHRAIGGIVDELADDSVLAERGATNGALVAIAPVLESNASDTAFGAQGAGAAIVPLGPADPASLGGTMRGVADTVSGALAPMIGAARTGAGSGP
jgi:hypothetical protein